MRPGDVLIVRKDRQFEACMASSWTKIKTKTSIEEVKQNDPAKRLFRYMVCWNWSFDRCFYQEMAEMTIKLGIPQSGDKVDIHTLNIPPLRYARADMQSSLNADLDNKGRIQWSCRRQILVEYLDDGHDDSGIVSAPPWNFDI